MDATQYRAGLWSSAPLIIAFAYAFAVLQLTHASFTDWTTLVSFYARYMYPIWPLLGAMLWLIQMVRDQREGRNRSAVQICREFVNKRWDYDRGFSFIMPPATATILLASYNLFKQQVLPGAGFGYDRTLAAIDRTVFGTDAWHLTHAMLPSPWATQAIDLLYHPLFFPMSLSVALCSYMRPWSEARFRYLFGYALLWSIPGSLIAYLLPAGGPCFDQFLHPAQFGFADLTSRLAAQNAYLQSVGAPGLTAVSYQAHLISLFISPTMATLGGGISSTPSLHNGMAVLFICAAINFDKRLALIMIPYGLVIWFGSIHLGWHYAIDGVLGAICAISCWMVSKPLTGRDWASVSNSGGFPKPAMTPSAA